jgi:hypothetical protein
MPKPNASRELITTEVHDDADIEDADESDLDA